MPNPKAPTRWHVVRALPHDVAHFTQGLDFFDGRIVESVGRYGKSALISMDSTSGRTLQRRALPATEFAEGVTYFGGKLFQLTWRNGVARVYDEAMRDLARFEYAGEGWGITADERSLIVSDGTPRLQFRDPATFALQRTLEVRDRGSPVPWLNELEYARGRIYANVWHSDRVAVIDPRTGAVAEWIDFAPLLDRFAKPAGWNASEHVLNGIAFDPRSERFYITGKCWPLLFEIALDP